MATKTVSSFSWARYCEREQRFDSSIQNSVTFYVPFQMDAIEDTADDIQYTVDRPTRLDQLSYRFYGTVELWWVLALKNDLDFPDCQLGRGRVLTIPDPNLVRDRYVG